MGIDFWSNNGITAMALQYRYRYGVDMEICGHPRHMRTMWVSGWVPFPLLSRVQAVTGLLARTFGENMSGLVVDALSGQVHEASCVVRQMACARVGLGRGSL